VLFALRLDELLDYAVGSITTLLKYGAIPATILPKLEDGIPINSPSVNVLNRILLLIGALILFSQLNLSGQTKETRELFPVCEKGKCGYIDRTGKIAIPLQFNEAYDYSEGLARVVVGDKFGFIDQTGKIVIQPQFGFARDFTEGLAPMSDDPIDGKWGYLDKSGKVVIPQQFKLAKNFSEGLAPVEVERAGGLVHNRTGTRFLSLWGYINRAGELVIPPQLIAAFPFTNGVARLWTGAFASQNKYGLIDKTGKEIIEPVFDNIESDFHEGLAPFRIGNKWGFIDTTGKIVIEPQFDSARDFSEGLGRVAIKNKANVFEWGYIDRSGKIIIQPQFEDTGDFSEGLAWVRPFDSKVGYIDMNGKLIIKPKFDAANNFYGGLAQVMMQGDKKSVDPHGREYQTPKFGYIDKKGKFIWKPTYQGF
jgi:hypothetical protein